MILNRPCVFVANHQSILDILALAGLSANFKWVAKDSVFKIPIINWFMLMNGYICLQSGTITGIKKMMLECKGWLQQGHSIFIFPEGCRSADGELLPFKDGPFYLAVQSNVPVIPIVVDGTREILPKNGRMLCFCGHIRVAILAPVQPDKFRSNARQLSTYVRQQMQRALRQMREESKSISADNQAA